MVTEYNLLLIIIDHFQGPRLRLVNVKGSMTLSNNFNIQLKKDIWILPSSQKKIQKRRGLRTKWLDSCKNMFWPNPRSPAMTRSQSQEGKLRQMTAIRRQRRRGAKRGHLSTGSLMADVRKTVGHVSRHSRFSKDVFSFLIFICKDLSSFSSTAWRWPSLLSGVTGPSWPPSCWRGSTTCTASSWVRRRANVPCKGRLNKVSL